MENHAQNVMKKLVVDPFIKDLNWAYIWAICKPRHWNLGNAIGIENGIGIRTDATNAIISSSIRTKDHKLSWVAA